LEFVTVEIHVKPALIAAVSVLLFVASMSFGFADHERDYDHDRVKRLRDRGEILPLTKIIKNATQERSGRLIEAELEFEQGRYLYELELLDERGRLWKLYYDAKTGQQVKLKRKR